MPHSAGLHGDGHDDGTHHEICDRRGQADAHHFELWEAPDTEYQRVVGESVNHEATQHNDEDKARALHNGDVPTQADHAEARDDSPYGSAHVFLRFGSEVTSLS